MTSVYNVRRQLQVLYVSRPFHASVLNVNVQCTTCPKVDNLIILILVSLNYLANVANVCQLHVFYRLLNYFFDCMHSSSVPRTNTASDSTGSVYC